VNKCKPLNPGLYYASLGEAITLQSPELGFVPNYLEVAWCCFSLAAEVHMDPVGMGRLGGCLYTGEGVAKDPVQAVVWLQKAADLGNAFSKASLGTCLMTGDAYAEVEKDAPRGLALLREAVELSYGSALFQVAQGYVKGEGVEKDAAHGVALLLKAVTQEDETTAMAQSLLAQCYMMGEGVEADTVQAAPWCERAAKAGHARAIELLPIIRTCNLCGASPARQHCERCRKVRYCNAACQAGHWKRETNPHKGHCRRAADGGASTSRGA
jgi:TPR repeat protein